MPSRWAPSRSVVSYTWNESGLLMLPSLFPIKKAPRWAKGCASRRLDALSNDDDAGDSRTGLHGDRGAVHTPHPATPLHTPTAERAVSTPRTGSFNTPNGQFSGTEWALTLTFQPTCTNNDDAGPDAPSLNEGELNRT